MNEEQNSSKFKLGFRNFRKFKECPPIDVSGVTFLVGKNNSGKSTYIKGLLLMRDNFKTLFEGCENICHPMFSFKNADAGIFTYERALHRNAETNEIVFSYNGFEISVSGNIEINTEKVPITHIKFDEDQSVNWHFDFVNQTITCEINLIRLRDFVASCKSGNEMPLKSALEYREKIQKILANTKMGDPYYTQTTDDDYDYLPTPPTKDKAGEKGWEEYWEKHDKWDYFMRKLQEEEQRIAFWQEKVDIDSRKKKQKISSINNYIELNKKTETTITVPFPRYGENGQIFDLQNQIWKYAHTEKYKLEDLLSASEIDLIDKLGIGESAWWRDDSIRQSWSFGVEYIPARDIPKNRVFMADDTNSPFAQAIHNYYIADQKFLNSEREKYRSEALHRFVRFWIKEFEIGVDFKIEAIAERSYTCQLSNKEGDWVHLAEMGRGATQLMLLLLQVTAIFAKRGFVINGFDNDLFLGAFEPAWNSDNSLIIIEEPEQNLHPALQSKMADFFCSIVKKHGYHCLIETHSEYLIRRSQVIVGTKRYSSFAFTIYGDDVCEGITYKEDFKEENNYALVKNPFHIYYFPHDEWASSGGDPELPYEMGFREDGFFEKSFGPGFFDEASKWHLLLLNNSNN